MSSKAQNRMDKGFNAIFEKGAAFQCRFQMQYCQIQL